MKDFPSIFGDFQPVGDVEETQEPVEQLEEETSTEQESAEETEEEQPEPTTSSQEEETEETDFSFKPIWDELAEKGVLSFVEDKEYEDSEEGFQELIQDTANHKFEQMVQAIPEEYRSLMDHLQAGKSLTEWVERMDPEDYENADLEDEANQEVLVKLAYQKQGLSETLITKKLTTLKDKGLLEDEAQTAQEFLVENQKKERAAYQVELQRQQQEHVRQQEAQRKQVQQDINALEEVDGIKLTKEHKQQLHAFLTQVDKDGKTPFGKLLADPQRLFAMAAKEMLGVGKETYQRKAVTKATSTMKSTLEKYNKRGSVGSSGKTVQTNVQTTLIPTTGMPWGNK